jgi:putative OPT family oligopeptide transporter
MEQQKIKGLPSNAYTELKNGEEYIPVVPAETSVAEITKRSVIIGIIMSIVFSFAAAYLGLKVGQVFEAAIPIAILAVGISQLFNRKNTILENVIIQSIGSASGVVVAGGIFVIPALYILGLKPLLVDTFIAAFLGGCIGILFLIPLRRFFVAEQHGKLPFPEATATTEILVTGSTGGAQAKVLATSMIIGGLYDFFADAMMTWNYHLSTFDSSSLKTKALLGNFGQTLYEKFRLVFKVDSLTAFIGLGYIVGLRYSAVIAAGSVLSFLVLVPLVYYFGQNITGIFPPGTKEIIKMTEVEIFKTYVQKIGIGAIAMAGIISIIKFSNVIISAFSIGFKELLSGKKLEMPKRTQSDISMKTIVLIIAAAFILLAAFFIFKSTLSVGIAGLIIVFVLAFLFTTVAAYAIAIVGTNPVSGMTLITLIVTSLILSQLLPLDDVNQRSVGMTIALIMGCVVCTALSMSGGFITDLKVGYWIGATPRNQERYKFLGTIVAAASVSFAILLIDMAYKFAIPDATGQLIPNTEIVPAPQGNLMATIIKSLMDPSQTQPWLLFGIGGLVSIMLEMAKVPILAFALGMYLPIELNMPIFIGGFLSWLVSGSSKDKQISDARGKRGTLIASGFIAGGAIMGMIGAILNLDQIGKPIDFLMIGRTAEAIRSYFTDYGQWIGLVMFILVCAYVYFDSKRAKAES